MLFVNWHMKPDIHSLIWFLLTDFVKGGSIIELIHLKALTLGGAGDISAPDNISS